MKEAKPWSKAEEDMMRFYYHLPDGIDYLVLSLNRTRGSIWMKGMRMGLSHYMFVLRSNLTPENMRLNTIETSDGCWEWRGPRMSSGYGSIVISGKTFTAHRIMYGICNPQEPLTGWNINHHCDNPACINPEHLYRGTQRDNIQDQLKRGRHRWQRRDLQRTKV